MADGHVTVRTGSRVTGRLIFGLMILGAGVIFLLDNYGLADAGDLLQWWPLGLIAAGLINALGPDRRRVMGSILAGFGLWLLLHTIGYVRYGPFEIWPIFLVLLGVVLVSRALRGAPTPGADIDQSGRISGFAMMSGSGRTIVTKKFQGGDLTAMMGGHDIDLRKAEIADGSAVIDLFVMWGGIEMRIPEDWQVNTEALVIMGGIEVPTPTVPPRATLILRGIVVMGGVDIKH
jgi:hypothetical protein